MAVRKKTPRMFAAIDVGSFELCMKIFEISSKGLRQIDGIRHRLALGTDSYTTHKISYEKMEELFRILQEFTQIMKGYRVKEYQAYGTSAFRETENTELLLDQIRNRSGIRLEILSNSEQRFLDYKAIASRGEQFNHIIEKGTAIVDIGGGNIQLSLFDKGSLIITQSLKLGVLRLHERMQNIQPRSSQVEELLDEMIGGQLHIFKKIYMKDREIRNLIIMDDYLSGKFTDAVPQADENREASAEDFLAFANGLQKEGREEVADRLEMEEENVELLKISAGIMKRVVEAFEAEKIWVPGASLCDGIAYEYAERQKLKIADRDFEQDIIACAGTISKRYQGSHKRSEAIERIALTIFDGMRSAHGMGERERLLLRLAAILHDCGKFINMTNVGECSHAIIQNTEIIGLSHMERTMVADIVKYNHTAFDYVEDIRGDSLTVAKLTAILRIANALDKSQKQKITGIEAILRDDKLQICVDAGQDMLFEQDRFRVHAAFFEEVYGIRPVILHRE
ncbi:MAG: HD domain-containing protein [Lachnospiraceae bacterium]|nr:HD domain-containing protein [Lachnospiraceae bacterium]